MSRRYHISEAMVEGFIRKHPGCTQRDIAAAFPTGDRVYGSHKFVASIVTQMREKGKLPDVPRCAHCKRALTRGNRNTPLTLLTP